MNRIKKIIIPIFSFALLTLFDQLTKLWARNSLSSPKVLIDGVFELRYVKNTGAAFGILKGQHWLFYILAVIVLFAAVFCYIKYLSARRFLILRIIVVFICSGIVGNLIDRVRFGFVTDFFYISLIDFPVFNVADIYISWSMVLLIILLLFKYKDTDFKPEKNVD